MHDISFQCSHCRSSVVVRRSFAGQRISCTHCRAQVVVPHASETAALAAQRTTLLAATQRITEGPGAQDTASSRASLMTTQKILVDIRPSGGGRESAFQSSRPVVASGPKLGFSDLIQNLQRENEELRRQLATRSAPAAAAPSAPPGADQLRRLAVESEGRQREIESLRQRLETERRRADDAVKSAQQLADMFEALNARAVQAQSLATVREHTIAELLTELHAAEYHQHRAEKAESVAAAAALELAVAGQELRRLRGELDAASRQRDQFGTEAAWARQQVRELEHRIAGLRDDLAAADDLLDGQATFPSDQLPMPADKAALPASERAMLQAALAEVEDRARRLQAERDDALRAESRAGSLEQENAFLREQLEFAAAASLDIQRSRDIIEQLTTQNRALQQTIRALTLEATRPPTDDAAK